MPKFCKYCICNRDDLIGRGWHTDHCHDTGKVRGILCSACNKGIGLLGDNYEGVLNALKYLKRFTFGSDEIIDEHW